MGRPLSRYSTVAIILHWLIAGLILTNLWLGLSMGGLREAAKFGVFEWHQSIGVTVLLLSVLRLGWRLANPPPPEAPGMAHWEKSASGMVHAAFYLIMIGMPLSGWLAVSAGPGVVPSVIYHVGGFPGVIWPHLPIPHDLSLEKRKALQSASAAIHVYLSYCAYVLIGLHILGVLKHQVFDPNPVLPRMAPFLKRRHPVS
jgi:cytochrome b561